MLQFDQERLRSGRKVLNLDDSEWINERNKDCKLYRESFLSHKCWSNLSQAVEMSKSEMSGTRAQYKQTLLCSAASGQ